jgi:hypothetical protein
MADDKVKMPADGSGTEMHDADGNGELASRRDAETAAPVNAGESGGGTYSNPYSGRDENDGEGGFLGHGGQSRQGYYGKGQLGDKDVGESENAVSTED